MPRISTYGTQQLHLARLMEVQERVQSNEVRVSTKLKSTVFSGIAPQANRVLNMTNERLSANSFLSANTLTSVKLKTMDTALDGVYDTVTNIRNRLSLFQQGNPKDQTEIREVQEMAMQAMQELQGYLNTNIDGEHLFSGARVNAAPVELQAQTLTDFQARYDGYINQFPTTRSSNLLDLATTTAQTGAIKFTAAATQNFISTTKLNGALSHAGHGSQITVAGSTSNNQTYPITAQPPTNSAGNLLAEGTSNTAEITYTQAGAATNPATGVLTFSYTADGQMKMSAATAGALANMPVGMVFTMGNDAAYNGGFQVVSNDSGVVTFKNNTSMYDNESVAYDKLTIYNETDTAAVTGATSGSVTFDTTKDGLTIRPGTGGSFATVAAGEELTITGTSKHDGRYIVGAANADGSITLTTNPIALQVSKFREQSGRTDVTLSYGSGTGAGSLTGLNLNFNPLTTGERIHSNVANAFVVSGVNTPAVGDVFTLSSTSGVHDGVYEVVSNDGTDIVIRSKLVTNESSGTATLGAESWYKGDTLATSVKVSEQRSIVTGTFASDPTFEKMFRALGLVAQGVYGTAGGLENHSERVGQAMYLLQDALDSTAGSNPPFGTEEVSDLKALSSRNAQSMRMLSQADDIHKTMSTFLSIRVQEITQVDMAATIATMMSDQNTLEASYTALARTTSKSLLDYV